ncbi:4-hydroxy-tetrahydrodipicolinate synthase [Halocella sp. SP3-1]|uniref:4-hydroxy-tetrahydrodipicolinate synthase n=1 Tax=Halocella sp. SP3-1 TaxID=2382161 RepID=UPI000F764670|nr:4-hydroxy-tetrahydrodipicolinate synthase [Halocella sp. SP3-1]AZO93304.1 4-hydroxy-tetrahydrodipicolinate synthase [Halocella sp. SP3-1]
MKRMKGINTALLTPFTKEGKLDKEALKDHINFLVEKGVHGLYILGTTGEAFLLDKEERKEVAELAVEYADGRAPIFAMIGSIPTSNACELAVHAKEVGVSGIGAITPIYHCVNQQEIKEYYYAIAKNVGEDYPLYLYNLPGRSGSELLPDTVIELSKIINIVGIKNSMSDMIRLNNFINKTDDNFDVLQGCDPLILPAMVCGAKGAVSGISNVFPELFVKLYDLTMNENYEEARRIQKLCTEATITLKEGANLAYLKTGVEIRGLKKTYTRKPLLDISEEEIKALRNDMQKILEQI